MNSNQEMIYDDFENNPNVKALQEFKRKPFEVQEAAGRKLVQRNEGKGKEIEKNGYRNNDTAVRGNSRKTP